MTQNELTDLLAAPADYSQVFTEKMLLIKQQLESRFGVDCQLNSDMNYRAGQSLSVEFVLSVDGLMPCKRGGNVQIVVFVSSRSDLYTVIGRCLQKATSEQIAVIPSLADKELWYIANHTSPELDLWIHRISHAMRIMNYKLVEYKSAIAIQTHYTTALDGLSASVFERLFSEID